VPYLTRDLLAGELGGVHGVGQGRVDRRELREPLLPAQPEELNNLFKVDVRLPGKGNSNSYGARPVHLIITMIKWIRTSRLSIKS